jgi:intein/homing endonuclease
VTYAVRAPRAPTFNRYPGKCFRCTTPVPAGEGEVDEVRVRTICASCALSEGFVDNGLRDRLGRALVQPDGRELRLRPFQEADAKVIGTTRSCLIGHQMGCGKCNDPDTLVLLNGTLVRAEDAWLRYSSAPWFDGEGWWSDPTEPLFVNSINDRTGGIVRRPVRRLYRQRVKETLRRVRLDDGSEVTITQVHKLRGPQAWTNEIQKGDRVCVPFKLLHEEGVLDLELAELFGWMVGEGCSAPCPAMPYTLSISQKDEAVLEHLRLLIGALPVNVNTPRIKRRTDGCPALAVNSKAFKEFCEAADYPWGSRSAGKRVPSSIMQGNAAVVRAFLRAYMDADGSCPKGNRIVELSSASQRLAKELSVLFRRFGIWVRIRKKRAKATNSRTPTERDYWVGTIAGESLRRYRGEIGFGVAYKQAELEAACAKKCNTNTEGVPASAMVRHAVAASGLPPAHFGLDPRHGLSSVYLEGTQEFSRSSLGIVVAQVGRILSGEREAEVRDGPRTRWKIPQLEAYETFDTERLRRFRDTAQRLIDQEVHYATVASVEGAEHDGWVYDLEVEGDHNYVAEGILCHNTPMAAVAALRQDTGNLIFCPASVKRNWGREIERWRPGLKVKYANSQLHWRTFAPEVMRTPSHVLIGSFGVLPGTPCAGCRYLCRTLKKLKKKDSLGRVAYDGPIPGPCVHFSEFERHPLKFTACINGKIETFDYHKGCKGKDRNGRPAGCYQDNPVPADIPPGVLLLADECHAFKNPRTARTKNWRALREAIWAETGYVFGLSGTPCEGKPPEFWNVLVSLGLERAAFGSWNNYYRIFRDWYDNKKGSPLRRAPQGELRDELHRRLKKVLVVRRRKDVLKELPPVVEQVIEVEMDAKTVKAVNEAVHRMLAVRAAWNDVVKPAYPSRGLLNPYDRGLSGDEKHRRKALYDQRVEEYFQERPWNEDEEIKKAVEEALNSRDSLPAIEELSRIRSMLSQAKVAAVEEWMQNCEAEVEPAIVFSEHVQILKKLMDRPGWECFHGGLSAKKRDVLVEGFQGAQIEHGMGVSIRAGGEGITLTRARVCGFIDVSWNPAKNAQALSRLVRIGAEKHDSIVAVYFRANHVVDQLVQETIFEKQMIMDSMEWDTSMAA